MGRLFVGRGLGTSGRMLCGFRRGRRGECRGMWRGAMRACFFGGERVEDGRMVKDRL